MATPCIDDHMIPPKDYETFGGLSAVCAQIVPKCMHLARIGGPDLVKPDIFKITGGQFLRVDWDCKIPDRTFKIS